VLAFEPYPPLAARLCADFGANVQVQTCALSDYEGQALLAVPQVDGKDLATRCTLEEQVNTEFARRTLRVRVRRLDSFGLTALGFVKIDVEGHELAVLRGAPLTLARNQPTILVSCEERHVPGDRERIRVMLQALDYSGWFVDHGRLRPLAEFDVQMHQRPELAKAPGAAGYTGDYIFNFIYVHPSRAHVLERLRSGLRQVPHGNLVAGRLSGGKASVHDPVPGGVSLAQMAQGRFRAVPRR
jgi:FkbM family methyltransferase